MELATIIGVLFGVALGITIMLARLEIPTRFAKWYCERTRCTHCVYYKNGGCKIGYPGGWRTK